MKKAFNLLIVIAFIFALPAMAVGGSVVIDFESYPDCYSVEGLGAVHPDLNITTKTGFAVVTEEGTPDLPCASYGASNDSSTGCEYNGCIGKPGGVTPVCGRGKGFAEVTPDRERDHEYTFTFGGKTVSSFSIMMLDFGDLNTKHVKTHIVKLIAYDNNENVSCSSDDTGTTLSYTSDGLHNPRSSDKYGDL